MRGLTIGSQIADLYRIGVDIDEAPGAFARTFVATNGDGQEHAFKVFRWEHFDLPEDRCYQYYKTLANEADLLAELKGHPNVVQLYDMGFIWPKSADSQEFEAVSFGLNAQAFGAAAEKAFSRRCLPYLLIQRMPSKHSLFRLVRRNPRRVRLPTMDILGMALQLASVLVSIHARGILYWDPKPEHVYWSGEKVTLIDWNVSRRVEKNEAANKSQDIQLIAQRVIYPVLMGGTSYATGTTIEATPGSSPDVVERDRLDYGMEERWLDPMIRGWLDTALLGRYETAEEFLRDVQASAVYYGWKVRGCEPPLPRAQRAHANMEQGLEKLRDAHALLDEASKHFAQAGIEFAPGEYREAKRLSSLVRDLLGNNWMLP